MYKNKAVDFVFKFFTVLIFLISSLTSFAFFFIYFQDLVPAGLVDTFIRQLIAGFVGVLLFDFASLVWLFVFLNLAETSEQRAISLSMSMFAFLGAAAASVAHFGLSATGAMALDSATRETIGIVSLVIVILGVVANFAAVQLFNRFSLESKEAVAESDRRESIQIEQEKHAKKLDALVAKQMADRLGAMASEIADRQSRALADEFYKTESLKFAAESTHREPELVTQNRPIDSGNEFMNHSGLTRKECKTCGKDFLTKHKNRVYCTPECRPSNLKK